MKEKLQLKSIAIKDVESIKAEYFNENFIAEPVYVNYRINVNGMRYYARIIDNQIKVAPSRSAISQKVIPKSKYIIDWQVGLGEERYKYEMKHSADYGTFLHILFGKMLRGAEVYLDERYLFEEIMKPFFERENIRNDNNGYNYQETINWYYGQKSRPDGKNIIKDVAGFIVWNKDFEVEPIAMEYPVFDMAGCRSAGTIDLVARIKYKGKKIISSWDFKSNNKDFYDDNIYQAYEYSYDWNQEWPDLKIERFFGYGCKKYHNKTLKSYLAGNTKTTPYRWEDFTGSDLIEQWEKYVEIFHCDKDNMKIEPRLEFDHTVPIKLGSEIPIEEVNPLDYVKDILDEGEEGEAF